MSRNSAGKLINGPSKFDDLGRPPIEAFQSCFRGEPRQFINSLIDIGGEQSLVNCRGVFISIGSYIPENKRDLFKGMWQRCDVEDYFGGWNFHYWNCFYRFSQINQDALVESIEVVDVANTTLLGHFRCQLLNFLQQCVHDVYFSIFLTHPSRFFGFQVVLGLQVRDEKSPKNCRNRPNGLKPSRPSICIEPSAVSNDASGHRAADKSDAKNHMRFLHKNIQSCLKGILA